MQRITTTTTNYIEGAEIEKYIDIISTNVVVGTNLLSDFAASITGAANNEVEITKSVSEAIEGKEIEVDSKNNNIEAFCLLLV